MGRRSPVFSGTAEAALFSQLVLRHNVLMVSRAKRMMGRWRTQSRAVRYVLTAFAVAGGLVLAALLTSPFWLTPILQSEKPVLEAKIAAQTGAPVHMADLGARVGWRLGFAVQGLVIGAQSKPAVSIRSVRLQLSWLGLLHGQLAPALWAADGLRLNLRKTASGFHVQGLPHHQVAAFHWQSFLRKQPALSLADAHIGLVLSPHRRLSIQQLNATWSNGIRGRVLRVAAVIPGVCGLCALHVELDGHSFRPRKFRGALGVSAQGLKLSAVAQLVRRPGLKPLTGSVSGRLWTTWQRGSLGFAGGDVHIQKLVLPATHLSRLMSVPQLSGKFSLKTAGRDRFRFYAADVRATLGAVAAQTGTLSLGRHGSHWRIRAHRINLRQADYVLAHLRHPVPTLMRLLSWRPRGQLRRLQLRLRTGSSRHYRVKTRFVGLGLRGSVGTPRFSQASGSLFATTTEGRLILTGLHGPVRVPKIVPGALTVQDAAAKVTWRIAGNGFSTDVPVFHLATTDGTVNAALSAVVVKGHSPRVLLAVALQDINVGALGQLYPRSLRPHLRHWLKRTIRGGVITTGQLTLKGPLNRFPFRKGGGIFKVKLHVVNGRYRFLPRWPEARHVQVTVGQDDALLSVQGSGRLAGVAARLSVHAGPLGTPGGVALVRVRGRGDLAPLLAIVLPHVHKRLRRFLPSTISGQGPMRLMLAFHIPFQHKIPLTLRGSLGLKDARLHYPTPQGVLHFRELTGRIGFTQKGPADGQLSGAVLGGPFWLALKTHGPTLIGRAHGTMSASGLDAVAGAARPYVHGPLSWDFRLTNNRRFRVVAQANLRNVAVVLPYPAGKAKGVPAVARATLVSGPGGTFFHAAIVHHLSVAYRAPTGVGPATWVGIGSAPAPKVLFPGLAIAARSAYVNADAWVHFVDHIARKGAASSAPVAAQGRSLRSLHLDVGSLVLAGRPMGSVHALFARAGTRWQGVVSGPNVDGTVGWRPHGRPALLLRLQRLVIPPRPRHYRPHSVAKPTDPRTLPAVQLVANSVTVDGRNLGHVAVDAAPFPGGYQFGRILLVRKHTTVQGHGRWTLHAGQQESTFALILHSRNLGDTLTAWGLPHQVAGGRALVHTDVNWPGGPTHFSLDRVEAKVRFLIRDGRFVQVRQGASKLLGIFNVDSITHYLTLDFSNIFGRGFGFSRIDGMVLAEQGAAIIADPIHIQGASANIVVLGRAGLVKKTFDLTLKVNPHLQNNVTLASGLLGGPIAGAAVLVMQKIFAREINHGTRLTYFIKGPWSKPIIRKKTDKD